MSTPIYTIGYGSRSIEAFILLLKRYNVQYLVDVRSQPYSKYRPDFTRETLSQRIKDAGMSYLFMGDSLGGRPEDKSCYVNGRVDYIILRDKPFYLAGIERLQVAVNKDLVLAVMCSEEKPEDCHRAKLIGKTLAERGIEVLHIDEAGAHKSQEEVLQALTNGQQSMFEDVGIAAASRKRYKERAG